MMYGLRSDSLSMNFLSDKYAFSYTDWLSCKPVLTLCQSTYKHTYTYLHVRTHMHMQACTHNSPENNDSSAWGRIVWMPGAVHWYQFHETWLQRISYKHKTRLRDTAVSAKATKLQSQEWFAKFCTKIDGEIKFYIHSWLFESLDSPATKAWFSYSEMAERTALYFWMVFRAFRL